MTFQLASVRPMVRYVDSDRAVIEVHFNAMPELPRQRPHAHDELDINVAIHGSDGYHDEHEALLQLHDGVGKVRFDIVQPELWWPAGMGSQPLYNFDVLLSRDNQVLEQRHFMIGLTSIRRGTQQDDQGNDCLQAAWTVNGQRCPLESVVVVDRTDENNLLPVTGDSLLLVRDHYGPEVLYEAADRAGILLVQCVPIHPNAMPEKDMANEVERLAPHACLAGWYVGHLGRLSDMVAAGIQKLDPTRPIFRESDLPVPDAA